MVVTNDVIADPTVAPPTAPRKESIEAVIEALKQCEQPEMPVTHRFSPGIYCRETLMPALPGGTLVVGHVHKAKCQNIVLAGRAIITIDGVSTEICAPFVFESDAGSQKFAVVLEDLRWLTVHPNPDNITDIPTIEDMVFALPEEIRSSGVPLDDFRMNRNKLMKGEA